jgi:hypothetical protein
MQDLKISIQLDFLPRGDGSLLCRLNDPAETSNDGDEGTTAMYHSATPARGPQKNWHPVPCSSVYCMTPEDNPPKCRSNPMEGLGKSEQINQHPYYEFYSKQRPSAIVGYCGSFSSYLHKYRGHGRFRKDGIHECLEGVQVNVEKT